LYGDDAPVQADDDAQDPLWYSLYEMYRVHLAFDHFGILYDAATHWIAAQQPEWRTYKDPRGYTYWHNNQPQ
jgi:hypothetical protein